MMVVNLLNKSCKPSFNPPSTLILEDKKLTALLTALPLLISFMFLEKSLSCLRLGIINIMELTNITFS